MNKIMFLFVGLFLFLTFGCEKDPVVIEPTVINIIVSDTNPVFNGISEVNWSVEGQCEKLSVSLNGKEISNNSTGKVKLDSIDNN